MAKKVAAGVELIALGINLSLVIYRAGEEHLGPYLTMRIGSAKDSGILHSLFFPGFARTPVVLYPSVAV